MADTEDLWSIPQDGCLSLETIIQDVTYNSLLNAIILSCKDQSLIIVDALSGTVLQKSDLSGHKSENIKCRYLAEKDRTVLSDGSAIGVRGDLQGILLLDTALQTPVRKTEETVKIELPLVEATHLLKSFVVTDLSGKEYVDDFIRDLSNGVRAAQDATLGNHKTAKWTTVCLEMQHVALKSVCVSLIEELTKTSQKSQGLPVASAIVDRLSFLLPSSRADLLKEPVNRALMYSEAARRETFKNWPHMNYKWALPDPMAQAGFFHHPNIYGDDRAMCFTCNVCLVCWEPTDEPWSEHERHSQLCPYIKGDFTMNVPLALTYATQPAHFHGSTSQEKISCLSTTFNEDFIATSSKDGNIVVWDISHIVKKHCQFDIDITDALVALKTGLQIEKRDEAGKTEQKPSTDEEDVQEISLHKSLPQYDHSERPSNDMHVTALCVSENKIQEDPDSPSKSSTNDTKLSVVCGVSLRRTKSSQKNESHSMSGSSRTVQLMNEVNETVSSESCDPRLITDGGYCDTSEFHLPESQLVPYIVYVSLVEQFEPAEEVSPTKKKSSPVTVKSVPVKEDPSTPPSGVVNNAEDWPVPWEYDSDCQIIGFTPAPNKANSSPFTGTFASADETKQDLSNGPSDIFCDNVDSSLTEPITPTKPFTFSFANTSNSSTNSVANINGLPQKEVPIISGKVVQCIELPESFQKEGLEITYLIPSIDKQHVVVVLSTKVGFLESSTLPESLQTADSMSPQRNSSSISQYCGGGILVYRLKNEGLEELPVSQMPVTSPRDVITSVLMLPSEVEDQVEEQSMNHRQGFSDKAGVTGHIVITTASGTFKILCLSNWTELTSVSPGQSEKFISSVYCSGIERLCVCSDNGKLYFYDLDSLGDQKKCITNTDVQEGPEGVQEGSAIKRAKMDEDMVDHPGSDYLTKHPLTPESLTQFHNLTQFENLMPRFTAVVPPCWSEIQQEQQQRRHPQHLQQQGEAMQHTRTWKLSADAGQTWDEHLMEILLPKPCAVGHIDVKFTLNPMWNSHQPNIEVTLLKQNIGSMHRPSKSPGMQYQTTPSTSTEAAKSQSSSANTGKKPDVINNVLDPKFLDSLKAEILCGPIKLANCLDLSGSGGLITLTSSQLLNSKPRSLLLHIKGFENSPLLEPFLLSCKEKTESRSSIEKMIQKAKRKNLGMYKSMLDEKHNIKGIFDSVTQTTSDKTSGKQKITTVKGCDWFQEISVTVRVFKKLNICNEKLQRNSMIQDSTFHKRLIQQLVSPNHGNGVMTASSEHIKNMVLDILIWVLSVQTNDLNDRSNSEGLLHIVKGELRGIVTSCYIIGSRTNAHKCSRLLILCMESSKNCTDPDLAPAFSQCVLMALLSSYHLLPLCKSSGAMRWFFAIFNRVKCMDIELVAEKTCEVLHNVCQEYSSRTLALQALLKTRYGLSGNPFEAELFDMEISGITKPTTTIPRGNPLAVCMKTGSSAGPTTGSEHLGLYEMLTSTPEKVAKNQPECLRNDILGLLEVEPLHFRCHATSDGTRMERLDTSANLGGTGTSTSVINPTPSYLIPFQSLGNDEPPTGGAGVEMSSIFSQSVAGSTSKLAVPFEMFKAKKSILGQKTYIGPSKMQGGKLFQQLHLWKQQLEGQSQSAPKHPIIPMVKQMIPSQIPQQSQKSSPQPKQISLPQMHGLLQTPAPQVLIIERMHSGARRFVTLDFGKPIVLTDIIIPCSIDLASLSIDVWVEGEEVDGQRLVVASDIGTRALVMNNIMPAPVCRYLKITTVGRYSGSTIRSRIRLGSFYGHTYILPWEWPSTTNTTPSQKQPRTSSFPSAGTQNSSEANGGDASSFSSQTNLLSQLGLFLSLMEDLQCRFNLARNRMESLLTSAKNVQHLSAHVQYHLKRSASCKLSEEDGYIMQAYNECMQLQLQMNLAQRAIYRLQTSLGITSDALDETMDFSASLKKSSTDKLRMILENLLDLLLTATVGSPAIPQAPVTLYNALTPEGAESLFQHLCLHGTHRIHVSAGLLLVRICGTQDWWGKFLGKMLQNFFHSKCSEIFPQDRVFVLLCSLGQKSLSGPSSQSILDSLLAILANILKPLQERQTPGQQPEAALDLSLISWVLLFLCRNMDCSSQPLSPNSEDSEKGAKKDKEACAFSNMGSRWSFIDNQCSGTNPSSSKTKSHRLHKRGFQRKIALCRQKIHEIDKLKASLSIADKNKLSAKILLKDVIDLHKLQSKGARIEDESEEKEPEPSLAMSRERCLSVVQGLVALILSMDFTCHVDLYLIACKVLSKICLACRPSITLAEATTQDQLEKLVLLVVGSEFNHDSLTWGGPWAGHAITCLLQDILEGEKIYASSNDDVDTEASDLEISMMYTQWLEKEGTACENKRTKRQSIVVSPDQVEACLRQRPEFYKYFKRDFMKGNICIDEKEDPIMVVSMFVNKKDKDKWNKCVEAITKHQIISSTPSPPLTDFVMEASDSADLPSWVDKTLLGFNQIVDTPSGSSTSTSMSALESVGMEPEKVAQFCIPPTGKKCNDAASHAAISDLCAQAISHGISQGLSTALDARLEFGLETMPEHRLKVIQSVQMNNIQCAFSSPLPGLPPAFSTSVSSAAADSYNDRDEASPSTASRSELGRGDLQNNNTSTSIEMLSQCFELVFGQLRSRKVNLESALQLWLTLNEDQPGSESATSSSGGPNVSGTSSFDATRQPVIALSENAVASLMEIGVLTPCLPVRIWVYLFQTLCLLTNQRLTNTNRMDVSLAPCVLNNSNLAPLLTKFLSSHNLMGSSSGGMQHYQAGSAAVKVFGDFLYRLECKSIEVDGRNYFKEMLLKMVYNLTAERGAIYQCIGPIDAQVKFLEMLSENAPSNIDVSNTLSVIQTVTTLVHHNISFQEQVACRTSQNTSLEARTCFGGLVASLLRGNDSKPSGTDNLRNLLMFFLLQLVNKLIMTSVSNRGGNSSSSSSKVTNMDVSSSWDAFLPSGSTSAAGQDASASGAGSRMNPHFVRNITTNIRLSDDEKSRSRDQQLHEINIQSGNEDEDESTDVFPTSEIADIVVGNPVIMASLIESLSYCSSTRLAVMFAQTDNMMNLQKTADQTEAVTVGDLIFTILKNLQGKCSDRAAMVDHLFKFFVGTASPWSQSALTRISEPLLFFTLRALCSYMTVKKFYDLGGISVIGSNFVRCNQQMISSTPSIISTFMQNFSQGQSDFNDKTKGVEADLTDGLQNFAHLGSISSSSPTASPADGLIQNIANRRARSATWSYHFYPDEPCVELTIHLPFAVLLKYVHIRPHGGAISACPSYVSLELSHDGNVVSAASPPMVTSSLSLIRLQLVKPEVVTAITIILYKPKDSMAIGLQNISLWGQTAFSEGSDQAMSLLNEEGFSRSSLGWMRILHHCLLMSPDDMQCVIAHAAASIPNLLCTCTSLLVHPQIGIHAPQIETILIKIGLCDSGIGLALLDSILGRVRESDLHHGFLGKISGMSSPYTVEILFRLGTTQDDNVQSRVEKLVQWLKDCSIVAQEHERMNQTFMFSGPRIGSASPNSPSPEHVQCVAAILWHSAELPVSYPLHSLVPVDFIRSMFDWAMIIPGSNLRKAVTNVLCAACHISEHGYIHIQEWMGIVDAATGSQVVAPSPIFGGLEHDMRRGRMTDDSKGASTSAMYNQDGLTDDSKEARRLQSLSTMNLDEAKLMLLASACKSPAAMRQLMNSGLPSVLAQAVCEFCSHQMMMYALLQASGEGDIDDEGLSDQEASHRGAGSAPLETGGTYVTAGLVSSILRFFTEISTELEVKEWLGQAEGNAFWSLLLTLLCGAQYQIPVIGSVAQDWTRFMTGEERSELENRTIQFFTSVISFHSENQLLFAKVLCDVIKDQGITKTDLLSAMPLSGFMRRLLLQVLLEDEKISVAVRVSKASGNSAEEESTENASFPFTVHEGPIFHPRYGCGRSCQCITMNFHSKCSEVLSKVTDAVPVSSIWPEKKEEKKKRLADYKKEALGELDVEVLELISYSAAASAKERREKSPLTKNGLPPRPPTRRGRQNGNTDSMDSSCYLKGSSIGRARLQHIALLGKDLPLNLTLAQLLQVLSEYALLPPAMALQFVVKLRSHPSLFKDNPVETMASDETLLASPPFQSALKVFAGVGGLALLAEHLPLLFPEISRQSNNIELVTENSVSDIGHDWVTVESSDELYDPYYDSIPAPQAAKTSKHPLMGLPPSIPPHSLIAFGLFLRLPGYAEVLLKERQTGQCLLRLVLGVTDDGDGGQILTSPIAPSLPTMPFTVLQTLFDSSPLTTDDGVVLRRMSLDIGVVHLVLACLSTLSHHKPRAPLTSFQHETQLILSAMQSSSTMTSLNQPEEKGQQHYWAKGTGFGTGSTTSSWDAEQAMLRQKGEEEHVACLLQVLASFINPNTSPDPKTSSSSSVAGESGSATTSLPSPETKNVIPESLAELLFQSCLVPALSSYLRNDSVLDMARHVPLYRALLQLLRGITVTPSLVSILLPMDKDGNGISNGNGDSQASIEALLEKMKGCVDTYASRLKSNKGKSDSKLEDEESEGLALLIPDIQKTAEHVRLATQKLKAMADKEDGKNGNPSEESGMKSLQTIEEKYIEIMKELQFDTFELVTEEGRNLKFNVSHHYESNVKAMGTVNNVARTRRLAQEAVTLSTSLPLAFSSSVFVRCDEERLDVMKVLITGPCDTPYANGCFEFDVFFPQDYPNSPPFINMETTGNHSVRFNPNLYNDGKVCLSVLNTWHGRPEEKWNAQTSSFLQVLVSIQSLILVSEPYFNEPGYERSRGTPSGAASSHEYDANIQQATVKWAMLEQLKNPSSCFKEILHTHFWLKRHEVLQQCEKWIAQMETYSNDKRTGRSIAQSTLALKRHYNQLREELSKLKPPSKLNVEEDEMTAEIDPEAKHYETVATPTADRSSLIETDNIQDTASSTITPPTTQTFSSALKSYVANNLVYEGANNSNILSLSGNAIGEDEEPCPIPATNSVAMSLLSSVLVPDIEDFDDASDTLDSTSNPDC